MDTGGEVAQTRQLAQQNSILGGFGGRGIRFTPLALYLHPTLSACVRVCGRPLPGVSKLIYALAAVSDEKMSSVGTDVKTQATPDRDADSGKAKKGSKRSWKARILTWLLVTFACLLVAFFTIRWAGTATYRGKVQRVYEKGVEYRIEFADLGGKVRVVGNKEITFPYVKMDTADLHADLNRLSDSGDIVDLRVWGFRQAWFSMFPNAIDVTFVRSDAEQDRAKAGRIADEVLETLRQQGVLKGGDGVRPVVVEAIERGMKIPDKAIDAAAPASTEGGER